jgi:hypothetical protein
MMFAPLFLLLTPPSIGVVRLRPWLYDRAGRPALPARRPFARVVLAGAFCAAAVSLFAKVGDLFSSEASVLLATFGGWASSAATLAACFAVPRRAAALLTLAAATLGTAQVVGGWFLLVVLLWSRSPTIL